MRCPQCGGDEKGKYCSQCGSALRGGPGRCASCGSGLEAGAAFCGECGAPTGARRVKPAMSYLPWILSGVALVAFAIAITLFVRGQALERESGMPVTGGLPSAPQASPVAGAMPTAGELAAMSPREAADRLFDRAMSTDEAGDPERAQFFANMAVQAYQGLPPGELDLDARFHVGLLRLVMKDPSGAEAEAEAILDAQPDHLLGLVLSARVAQAGGDQARLREAYSRFLEGLPAGLASGQPEYLMHDRMLESEAEQARAVTGRD